MEHQLPEHVDVAIVGAGFGGLGMAIQLERQGLSDFVVLERGTGVGGTWHANTYPGAQCDIPSNLYSFSFAPKSDWTRAYPEQKEIQGYLRGCVERFGIGDRVQLETELQDAAWDRERRRWRIETSSGPLQARVLVAAPGLLSEPSTPALPGLDRFDGRTFHTASWDHAHDLSDRDVAVMGTGATAVQVVPRIRNRARRLTVFQRTPPWVIPHLDREVTGTARRLYHLAPPLQRLARGLVYTFNEHFVLGMSYWPRLLKLHEACARLHMRRQVRDPDLRRRLIPDYSFGCKRVVLSNDWYPSLEAANVELVTSGVEEVRKRSLVAFDGSEHPADTIVFATGFVPTDPPIARRLRGSEGRTLSEVWGGSPQAYLATTVAGFPNLFLLYGPNSNLGHSSIVYMLESQVRYVMGALKAMRERGHEALEVRRERGHEALEVKRQVQDAYNEQLQRRLARSVWDSGGCGSWYLDANGRDSTQWPGFTLDFRRRTRAFDLDSYSEPAVSSRMQPATCSGSSNVGR